MTQVSNTDDRNLLAATVFYGKTVQNVDCSTVNCWRFTFEDGTTAEIWADDMVFTPFGNIPGLVLKVGP